MLETGDISRFSKVGQYSSYCRKVPSKWSSNNKKKGKGNVKNGNKYLACCTGVESLSLTYCTIAKCSKSMARALRIQYLGALYHITNRVNGRRAIFKDDVDRKVFLEIISQSTHTCKIFLSGYIALSSRLSFVDYDIVLAEHGGDTPAGRSRYQKQIIEVLAGGLAIKKEIVGQSILGGESFVSWVRDSFLVGTTDREKSVVGKIHQHLSMEAVVAIVEKAEDMEHALQSTGALPDKLS